MPPVVSNASTKSATLHARRWRRWLVFLLAGVGTLALGLIAIVAVTRPDQAAPVHFSADGRDVISAARTAIIFNQNGWARSMHGLSRPVLALPLVRAEPRDARIEV